MGCNDGYPDTGTMTAEVCEHCGYRNTHTDYCDCQPCAICERMNSDSLTGICDDCLDRAERHPDEVVVVLDGAVYRGVPGLGFGGLWRQFRNNHWRAVMNWELKIRLNELAGEQQQKQQGELK